MKERIKKWFFKKEYAEIETEKARLEILSARAKEFKEKDFDIVDLIRKRLKGVNTDVVYTEEMDTDELLVFCAEAKKIFDSKAFHTISSRLIKEQKDISITEARDLTEVNFGRGTINGITVFVDEVERLAVTYEELKKRDDAFDKFDVV